MPDITGTELAKAIHELRPATPFILYSGYYSSEADELRPEGVSFIMSNPFNLKTLASGVRNTLDQSNAKRVL